MPSPSPPQPHPSHAPHPNPSPQQEYLLSKGFDTADVLAAKRYLKMVEEHGLRRPRAVFAAASLVMGNLKKAKISTQDRCDNKKTLQWIDVMHACNATRGERTSYSEADNRFLFYLPAQVRRHGAAGDRGAGLERRRHCQGRAAVVQVDPGLTPGCSWLDPGMFPA